MLAARLKARSETAVEDEDRAPKYENGVVVSSEGLSREDLESFEVRTATTLHDMWRSARGTTPDGRFIPRIKTSDGKKFDIANLHFKQLPVSGNCIPIRIPFLFGNSLVRLLLRVSSFAAIFQV